jgi:hypothetical protein
MKFFGYRTSESGMSAIRTWQIVHADSLLYWLHMHSSLLSSLPGHHYAQQHEGWKRKKAILTSKNMDVKVRPENLYNQMMMVIA